MVEVSERHLDLAVEVDDVAWSSASSRSKSCAYRQSRTGAARIPDASLVAIHAGRPLKVMYKVLGLPAKQVAGWTTLENIGKAVERKA